MKDKPRSQDRPHLRARGRDDGLGPNSDIGAKLRALYGAVQEEPIPERFLDLLDRLDEAERRADNGSSRS